jgi:hypothetical protein
MTTHSPTSPRFSTTRNTYNVCSSYKSRNWYLRNVAKVMEPMVYTTLEEAIEKAGLNKTQSDKID